MLNKDITFVKRNIKCGEYFVCLPVKWDKRSGKVVILPGAQKILISALLINLCVVFCRLLSTLISTSSLLDRAQAAIGAVFFVTGFLIRFDIPMDHVPVQLINFLLKENEEFGSARKASKFQLCLRFVYLACEVTAPLISALLATLTMLSPCQPVLLSRLFCPRSNFLCGKSHFIIQSFLGILEIVAFEQLAISSIYYLTTVLLQAAQINNLSRNWISLFKRKCRNRVERRMHKSLMSLRLEFGNNFVEALTPIVVQEFCVRQTVACLLITL
ncbi:hypothetical protein Fcan01_10303 [Folsomia candida]|uniref:Uncharacterized protein n=1 Tax=Folsomia candida TaxID=158441 RepID=A0A226E8B6_FOLCA|nr:hypothetical protein Fcan01_10303 [Folsomia candida]